MKDKQEEDEEEHERKLKSPKLGMWKMLEQNMALYVIVI